MKEYFGYFLTAVFSLIVGWLLQKYPFKPKLVYWFPGTFVFDVKQQKVVVRTDSITIQNLSNLVLNNIEIIHQKRPDHFQFSTYLDWSEYETPTGEHIIKIKNLGPKEHINLQILSYANAPVFLNVRSEQARGDLIQVHFQRVLPKFFVLLCQCFFWIGVLASLYGIYFLVQKFLNFF